MTEVGVTMPWGEAIRLTQLLAGDPSSMVCSSVSEWDSPRSREWFLLADLIDSYGAKNFKNPKPYPRPFSNGRRFGKTKLSRAEVIAILNKHGHDIVEGSVA